MNKQLLCKNEAWDPRNPWKAVYSACLQSVGTCNEMRCRNKRIPGNSQATSPGRCSAKDQESLPQIRWKMRTVPRFFSSLPGPTWHVHSAHIPATVHIREHAHHTYKEAEQNDRSFLDSFTVCYTYSKSILFS